MLDRMGLNLVLNMDSSGVVRGTRQAEGGMKRVKREARGMGTMVRTETDRMTAALSRYARGFTVGLKLMGAGAMIMAPFLLLSKGAATAEHAFTEVKSLLAGMGLSFEEIDRKVNVFRRTFDEVMSQSLIPYDIGLQGIYPLSSKMGLEDAEQSFEYVNQLAIAGRGNILQSVQLMNQLTEIFGGDFKRAGLDVKGMAREISRVTAGTVRVYDTELTKLAEGWKYAGPSALLAGLPFLETSSQLGQLSATMVTGSKVGTSYNAMIRGILKFTGRLKDKTGASIGTMDEFIALMEGAPGLPASQLRKNKLALIDYTDELGRLRPMSEIIRDIAELFGAFDPESIRTLEDSTDLLEAFSDEGVRALVILMENYRSLEERTKVLATSNVAEEMYNLMMRDSYAQTIAFTNSLKALKVQVGLVFLQDLPVIMDYLGGVRNELRVWTVANEEAVKSIGRWGIGIGIFFILAGAITVLTFSVKSFIMSVRIIGVQIAWTSRGVWWFIKAIWTLGKALLFTAVHPIKAFGMALVWTKGILIAMANWTPILAIRVAAIVVAAKLAAAATWLWNAALLASPITWIIIGIVALVAGIALLVIYWDEVVVAVMQAWTAFQMLLGDIPDWLLALVPMVGWVLLLIKHWDKVIEVMAKVYDWVRNKLIEAFTWFVNSDVFKTVEWMIKGLSSSMSMALGWLGFGSEEKVPVNLPRSGVDIGTPGAGSLALASSHSSDYSTHRVVQHIYPPSGASTGHIVSDILSRLRKVDGQF